MAKSMLKQRSKADDPLKELASPTTSTHDDEDSSGTERSPSAAKKRKAVDSLEGEPLERKKARTSAGSESKRAAAKAANEKLKKKGSTSSALDLSSAGLKAELATMKMPKRQTRNSLSAAVTAVEIAAAKQSPSDAEEGESHSEEESEGNDSESGTKNKRKVTRACKTTAKRKPAGGRAAAKKKTTTGRRRGRPAATKEESSEDETEENDVANNAEEPETADDEEPADTKPASKKKEPAIEETASDNEDTNNVPTAPPSQPQPQPQPQPSKGRKKEIIANHNSAMNANKPKEEPPAPKPEPMALDDVWTLPQSAPPARTEPAPPPVSTNGDTAAPSSLPPSPAMPPRTMRSSVCYSCGLEGHFARDCPQKRTTLASSGPPRVCWECKKEGHISRDCPLKASLNAASSLPTAAASAPPSTPTAASSTASPQASTPLDAAKSTSTPGVPLAPVWAGEAPAVPGIAAPAGQPPAPVAMPPVLDPTALLAMLQAGVLPEGGAQQLPALAGALPLFHGIPPPFVHGIMPPLWAPAPMFPPTAAAPMADAGRGRDKRQSGGGVATSTRRRTRSRSRERDPRGRRSRSREREARRSRSRERERERRSRSRERGANRPLGGRERDHDGRRDDTRERGRMTAPQVRDRDEYKGGNSYYYNAGNNRQHKDSHERDRNGREERRANSRDRGRRDGDSRRPAESTRDRDTTATRETAEPDWPAAAVASAVVAPTLPVDESKQHTSSPKEEVREQSMNSSRERSVATAEAFSESHGQPDRQRTLQSAVVRPEQNEPLRDVDRTGPSDELREFTDLFAACFVGRRDISAAFEAVGYDIGMLEAALRGRYVKVVRRGRSSGQQQAYQLAEIRGVYKSASQTAQSSSGTVELQLTLETADGAVDRYPLPSVSSREMLRVEAEEYLTERRAVGRAIALRDIRDKVAALPALPKGKRR